MQEKNRIAYVDPFVTIYPVRAISVDAQESPMYSYVGVPTQVTGHIDPKVAINLGCEPRLHFQQLKNGKSVTLSNGTVVTPEMVISESPPAESFIIVFLPSEQYI